MIEILLVLALGLAVLVGVTSRRLPWLERHRLKLWFALGAVSLAGAVSAVEASPWATLLFTLLCIGNFGAAYLARSEQPRSSGGVRRAGLAGASMGWFAVTAGGAAAAVVLRSSKAEETYPVSGPVAAGPLLQAGFTARQGC